MDIKRLHRPRGLDRGARRDIAAEYYASIVFDRSAKKPLRACSPRRAAWTSRRSPSDDPDAIARLHVDPLLGFQDFHGRRLAFEAGVDADVVRPIGALLAKLYDAFVAEEAMLVEVNPLIVTPRPRRRRRSTRRSRSTTTRSSATPTTPRCATRAPRTRRSRWRTSAG